MGNRGIGLPTAKLSFCPGGKTTLPLKEIVREVGIEREGVDPDIDPAKKDQNVFDSQYGYTSGEEIITHAKHRLEEISQAQGKAVRKDAVPLCSTIIKPHSEVINRLSRSEQEALIRAAVEEFQVIIGTRMLKIKDPKIDVDRAEALALGQRAIVMAAHHFDEAAPHLHIIWEPIIWDGDKPCLAAKKLHDKRFLGELNRELPKAMNRRGYNFKLAFDYLQATEEERKAHEEVPKGMTTMEYKKMRKAEAEKEIEKLQKLASEPLAEVPTEEVGILQKKTIVTEPEKLDEVLEQSKALKVSLRVKDEEISKLKETVKHQEDEIQELQPYKNFIKRISEQVVNNEFFDIPFLKMILQELPFFTKLQQEHEERRKQKTLKKPMLSRNYDLDIER